MAYLVMLYRQQIWLLRPVVESKMSKTFPDPSNFSNFFWPYCVLVLPPPGITRTLDYFKAQDLRETFSRVHVNVTVLYRPTVRGKQLSKQYNKLLEPVWTTYLICNFAVSYDLVVFFFCVLLLIYYTTLFII